MTTSPVILIETWIGDADDVAIVSESVTLNGDDEVIDYDFCVHVFYEVRHSGADGEGIWIDFVCDAQVIGCVFGSCRDRDANALANDSDFCFGDAETVFLLPHLTLIQHLLNHHQEGCALVQVDWCFPTLGVSECEAE